MHLTGRDDVIFSHMARIALPASRLATSAAIRAANGRVLPILPEDSQ